MNQKNYALWLFPIFYLTSCDCKPAKVNSDVVIHTKMTVEQKLQGDSLLLEANQKENNKSVIANSNNVFDYEMFFIRAASSHTGGDKDTIDYESINGDVYRAIMSRNGKPIFMPSIIQSRAYWKALAEKSNEDFDSTTHRKVYLTILNGYRKFNRNEFSSTKTPFYTSDTPDNSPSKIPLWDTEPGTLEGFEKFSMFLQSLPSPILTGSVELVSSEIRVDKNLQYFANLKFKNTSNKSIIGLMIKDIPTSYKPLYQKISSDNKAFKSKFKISILPSKFAELSVPVQSSSTNICIVQIYFKDGTIEDTIFNNI